MYIRAFLLFTSFSEVINKLLNRSTLKCNVLECISASIGHYKIFEIQRAILLADDRVISENGDMVYLSRARKRQKNFIKEI